MDRLDTYDWSSYPAYVGKAECPDWLYSDSVLSECGSSYRRYVERGIDEETASFNERDHWPAVRGCTGFVEQAHIRSNAHSKEVRRDRDVLSADVILKAVATELGCAKNDLLQASRGREADNRGRGIAMELCQEIGSMKLADMAELFEVGSDSAVSRSVSRIDELVSRDSEVRAIYGSVCGALAR